MTIKLTLVESSQIKAIGFDKKRSSLFVDFKKGGLYRYYPFTENAFQDFLSSESKGKHFHQFIRNNELLNVEKQ